MKKPLLAPLATVAAVLGLASAPAYAVYPGTVPTTSTINSTSVAKNNVVTVNASVTASGAVVTGGSVVVSCSIVKNGNMTTRTSASVAYTGINQVITGPTLNIPGTWGCVVEFTGDPATVFANSTSDRVAVATK